MIQRLIITRVPVLIGSGIPLFGPLPHDIALTHVATRQFKSGLVQSEYFIRCHGMLLQSAKQAAVLRMSLRVSAETSSTDC